MKAMTHVQFSTVNLNVVIQTTQKHAAKIAAYILDQAIAARKECKKESNEHTDSK